MYPGGNIIEVTPTLTIGSPTAFAAADVLFNSVEIPNAVSSRGGVSRLVAITCYDQADQGVDFDLIFSKNSATFGTINDVVDITDPNVEAAKIIGSVKCDFSKGLINFVLSKFTTLGAYRGADGNSTGLPFLLKAAEGSTSVYFAAIIQGTATFAAADDLDFTFHVEYL